MKRIIFGVMAAVAFLSCSKEQVIEVNRVNDEITFNVVADNQTKAAAVYCNNNLPPQFTVYAKHLGKTYIDGDIIEKSGTADTPKWINTSGVRFWPTGSDLITFYAYHNVYKDDAVDSFTWKTDAAPTVDFTVEDAVADQLDFIYAVHSQSCDYTNSVELNFRHALSQIVFKAKNTNPNLYVEIDGVSVCNVGNSNKFTFPADHTDDNVNDHNQPAATQMGNQGTWDELTGGQADYTVTFPTVAVHGNSTACNLTVTTSTEFDNNTMLLLPQTTTKWNPAYSATYATNSYFLVDCRIYNVAGDSYVAGEDVKLYDGNVAIPVSFKWAQGKKYIYTFVFGNGNGGYIPGENKPVLTPIEFTVTADDFEAVTEPDTPMQRE